MRSDITVKNIINFLLPLVFMYAAHKVFDGKDSGAVSFFNAILLICIFYIMYYSRYGFVKSARQMPLGFLHSILLILFFFYTLFVLLLFMDISIFSSFVI